MWLCTFNVNVRNININNNINIIIVTLMNNNYSINNTKNNTKLIII